MINRKRTQGFQFSVAKKATLARYLLTSLAVILVLIIPGDLNANGRQLNAEELQQLIPGARASGTMSDSGTSFRIKYLVGGVLTGTSGGSSDTGNWWLSGSKVCFKWSKWRGARKHCVFLHHVGGKKHCSFYTNGTPSACANYSR